VGSSTAGAGSSAGADSSTTGIAANLLGRQYLGIERDEKFAAISKARREDINSI
jgi:site-specific DNA-methyltransferase (adenine-specific)